MFPYFSIVHYIPIGFAICVLAMYFYTKRRLEQRIKQVEKQLKQERIAYFTKLYNLDLESEEK